MLAQQDDVRSVARRWIYGGDCRGVIRIRVSGGQDPGPERYEVGQGFGKNGSNDVAAEGGFELYQLAGVVDFEVYGVTGQSQTLPGGNAGSQVASIGGGTKEHCVGRVGDDGGR